MANNRPPQEIIDISSGDSDQPTLPQTELSTTVNWWGNQVRNITTFSNNVVASCYELVECAREISEGANHVQHFEIAAMQEALQKFHLTCGKLEAFCNLLQELAYDEYYGIGNASILIHAFHSILDDM